MIIYGITCIPTRTFHGRWISLVFRWQNKTREGTGRRTILTTRVASTRTRALLPFFEEISTHNPATATAGGQGDIAYISYRACLLFIDIHVHFI